MQIAGEYKKQLLDFFHAKEAFKLGKFTLSSGKESDYYLDCRVVASDNQGLQLICDSIFDLVCKKRVLFDSVGGPAFGADLLVGGILINMRYDKLTGWILRPRPKEHGISSEIVGTLGKRTIIVDDVATSGHSILRAVNYARENGSEVVMAICVVDRLEGAHQLLKENKVRFQSLLTANDFRERQNASNL